MSSASFSFRDVHVEVTEVVGQPMLPHYTFSHLNMCCLERKLLIASVSEKAKSLIQD